MPTVFKKITIIKTDDKFFDEWLWSVGTINVQKTLKSLIINSDLMETVKDDPIISSILDTDEPAGWICEGFTDHDWNLISSTSNCLSTNSMPSADIRDIRRHLYILFLSFFLV